MRPRSSLGDVLGLSARQSLPEPSSTNQSGERSYLTKFRVDFLTEYSMPTLIAEMRPGIARQLGKDTLFRTRNSSMSSKRWVSTLEKFGSN